MPKLQEISSCSNTQTSLSGTNLHATIKLTVNIFSPFWCLMSVLNEKLLTCPMRAATDGAIIVVGYGYRPHHWDFPLITWRHSWRIGWKKVLPRHSPVSLYWWSQKHLTGHRWRVSGLSCCHGRAWWCEWWKLWRQTYFAAQTRGPLNWLCQRLWSCHWKKKSPRSAAGAFLGLLCGSEDHINSTATTAEDTLASGMLVCATWISLFKMMLAKVLPVMESKKILTVCFAAVVLVLQSGHFWSHQASFHVPRFTVWCYGKSRNFMDFCWDAECPP